MQVHLRYRMLVVVARERDVAIYPVAACEKIQTVVSHSATRLQPVFFVVVSDDDAPDKSCIVYENVHIASMKLMN